MKSLLTTILVLTAIVVVAMLINPSKLSRDDQKSIGDYVYGNEPHVVSVPDKLWDELVVSDGVATVYKKDPRATIEFLITIAQKARPTDSILAVAYAIALLDGPPVGVVCLRHLDPAKYDSHDEDWGRTPRQHCIIKIRASMSREFGEK